MPTQVQFRRGTTAQNNSFTGAIGEISIDTSTNAIRVHNAVTAGGSPIYPTLNVTNAQRLAQTPQLGQVIFVTDYSTANVSPTWIGDGSTVGGVIAAGTVVSAATTASSINGGTAGQVPYQTGASVTAFFGPGTYGQVLLSGNTSGPTYTSTLTVTNGVVSISGSTNATSTSTGALVVTGGAGIGGNLYVGGKIVASELDIQLTTVTTTLIQTDDIISTYNTTGASSTTTGALVVSGGIGIGGGGYFGGIVTATSFVGSFSGSVTGTATTATNLAGGTAGQLHYQTGAGLSSFVSTATTGNFLQANYVGAPTWTTTASMYVQDATVATNLRSGTAGQLHYQTAANASGFVSTATTGNFLQANYVGAPTWTTTASIYVQDAVVSTNIRSGTAGQVPYQTGAGATSFITTATTGNFLQAN